MARMAAHGANQSQRALANLSRAASSAVPVLPIEGIGLNNEGGATPALTTNAPTARSLRVPCRPARRARNDDLMSSETSAATVRRHRRRLMAATGASYLHRQPTQPRSA
jgi:hypothetical protein